MVKHTVRHFPGAHTTENARAPACTHPAHSHARFYFTDGSTAPGSGGHNISLTDATETQIIVDTLEGGQGLRASCAAVNEYRAKMKRQPVGVSAVHNAVNRLEHEKYKVQHQKCGSSDPDSTWSQKRKLWVTQL